MICLNFLLDDGLRDTVLNMRYPSIKWIVNEKYGYKPFTPGQGHSEEVRANLL